MSGVPQLLTLLEAAQQLRLSPHTVRSFVRKGKLKPLRICRKLLFHPDDLARLIGHNSPVTEEVREGMTV